MQSPSSNSNNFPTFRAIKSQPKLFQEFQSKFLNNLRESSQFQSSFRQTNRLTSNIILPENQLFPVENELFQLENNKNNLCNQMWWCQVVAFLAGGPATSDIRTGFCEIVPERPLHMRPEQT